MRTISTALAAALTLVALSACSDAAPTATAPATAASLAITAVQGTGKPTTFRSRYEPDKCLSVPGGATTLGTQVAVSGCVAGAASQTFSWLATGEIKYGTLCLDAGGGAGRDWDPILVYTCHGGTNQKWTATAAGEIRGINGKCLDIGGWSREDGAKIQLYTCHGGANQAWDEVTSTDTAPAPASTPSAPSTPTTSTPSTSTATGDAAKVFALMGNVPSVAAVEALGGPFARYEQDFRTWEQKHWAEDGAKWESDYYDRAMIYYVWWARTGNQTYLDHANALIASYRTNYVEAVNYGIAPHWALFDGLAIHYALTGDERDRTAIGRMADVLAAPYYLLNLANVLSPEMESRQQARVLLAFVMANRLNAPSLAGRNWATLARSSLTSILKAQGADGAYRWQSGLLVGQCGYNKPWMVGLLNDAMIRYYTLFEQDARIVPAVKKSLDYMWARDWNATAQGFVYLDGTCGADGPEDLSKDLNNLITSGFGFVYKTTGDATYKTRGDAAFAGGITTSVSGSKVFNQVYTSSYRYLDLRQ